MPARARRSAARRRKGADMPEETIEAADAAQETPAPPAVDWQAKYEQAAAQSRKWEERSKANADKARAYDALAQQQAGAQANRAATSSNFSHLVSYRWVYSKESGSSPIARAVSWYRRLPRDASLHGLYVSMSQTACRERRHFLKMSVFGCVTGALCDGVMKYGVSGYESDTLGARVLLFDYNYQPIQPTAGSSSRRSI